MIKLQTGIVFCGLLIGSGAWAQGATPVSPGEACGPADIVVETGKKGDLDAKAQTLLKIGSGELMGAAESYKHEIMLGPNASDAAREVLYLDHFSCILIYQDREMKTDEKLQRIQVLKSALLAEEKSWSSPAVEVVLSEPDAESLS
jgi:hypothetical protein